MAASEPPNGKPAAAQQSMHLHCFERITRTGRLEPTARAGTDKPHEERRDQQLIAAKQDADHEHGVTSMTLRPAS